MPCFGLQALQYLRKLCSHPLLVLDAAIPAHVAAVEKATQLKASTPAAWKAAQPCLHHLAHAPKLLALQQLLQVCPLPVSPLIYLRLTFFDAAFQARPTVTCCYPAKRVCGGDTASADKLDLPATQLTGWNPLTLLTA